MGSDRGIDRGAESLGLRTRGVLGITFCASGLQPEARRWQCEAEFGALAGQAADDQLRPHAADQGLADDKAQSGAAEFTGDGAVALFEGLEELFQHLVCHADTSVFHGAPQPLRHAAQAYLHRARLGEFDGIAHQIHPHLPQPVGVAHGQCGHLPVHLQHERQPLGACRRLEQGERVLQNLPRAERNALELHLIGLDLGEVEDVVDERKQGIAGDEDVVDKAVLLGVERSGLEQLGQAQRAVHGGADLVAHHRQEAAFGHVGSLRLPQRGLQFGGALCHALLQCLVGLEQGEALFFQQMFGLFARGPLAFEPALHAAQRFLGVRGRRGRRLAHRLTPCCAVRSGWPHRAG